MVYKAHTSPQHYSKFRVKNFHVWNRVFHNGKNKKKLAVPGFSSQKVHMPGFGSQGSKGAKNVLCAQFRVQNDEIHVFGTQC